MPHTGNMTVSLRYRRTGTLIFPLIVVLGIISGYFAARTAAGFWIFLTVIVGWVISLCLHEFAHAVVALAGGDTSVKGRGYLTLNPLLYTSPVYSLVIPLILLAVGGIPLPGGAVLIENHRLRTKWWSSLVSAAGPLTNFILGVICTAVSASLIVDGEFGGLTASLAFLALLQFVTAILNVLPVPGFDGFGIIEPYLPGQWRPLIAQIRPWAPLVLFALLWSSARVSHWVFGPAQHLFEAFGGSWQAAYVGQTLFRFWQH